MLEELANKHVKMNGKGYSDLINFDFCKRKISNGKIIIYENEHFTKNPINGITFNDVEIETGSFEEIENLYAIYKYSIPEPYDKFAKHNFIAEKLDNLTLEQFSKAINRQKARIALEEYIFFHKFKWENEKHHYWQSKKYPSLVIYKDWIIRS